MFKVFFEREQTLFVSNFWPIFLPSIRAIEIRAYPILESRGVVKNPVALLNKPGAIMSKKQMKALKRMQLYSKSS